MNLDEQTFLRALGLRLRRRREEMNWTQADLAEKCDLHRTFIGSVERGERNVSLLHLRALAQAPRVPLPPGRRNVNRPRSEVGPAASLDGRQPGPAGAGQRATLPAPVAPGHQPQLPLVPDRQGRRVVAEQELDLALAAALVYPPLEV